MIEKYDLFHYADYLAALEEALKEKDESIVFWKRETKLADARANHGEKRIAELTNRLHAHGDIQTDMEEKEAEDEP